MRFTFTLQHSALLKLCAAFGFLVFCFRPFFWCYSSKLWRNFKKSFGVDGWRSCWCILAQFQTLLNFALMGRHMCLHKQWQRSSSNNNKRDISIVPACNVYVCTHACYSGKNGAWLLNQWHFVTPTRVLFNLFVFLVNNARNWWSTWKVTQTLYPSWVEIFM